MKKTKTKSVILTDNELKELKIVQSMVNHKELELRLAKHGYQNILKNMCVKYKLKPDATTFSLEDGTLSQ